MRGKRITYLFDLKVEVSVPVFRQTIIFCTKFAKLHNGLKLSNHHSELRLNCITMDTASVWMEQQLRC